jgi:hypothetical protein
MGDPANPAERDVNDSAAWRAGKPYYEGELVIETGMMFECLDVSTCGTTRPTSAANSSSSVWAEPASDSGLTEPPASKEIVLENHVLSRTWAEAADGVVNSSVEARYAYELGSMALTSDGSVWICDPYWVDNYTADVLFATEIAGEPVVDCTDSADLSTCTTTAVTVIKNVVPGCITTSP